MSVVTYSKFTNPKSRSYFIYGIMGSALLASAGLGYYIYSQDYEKMFKSLDLAKIFTPLETKATELKKKTEANNALLKTTNNNSNAKEVQKKLKEEVVSLKMELSRIYLLVTSYASEEEKTKANAAIDKIQGLIPPELL